MIGEELIDDPVWQMEEDDFKEELENRRAELSKKSDGDILNIAINCGEELNKVTEYFPAYTVALKLFKNNWVPTEKQRKAIINVTAFHQTYESFYGEHIGEDDMEFDDE